MQAIANMPWSMILLFCATLGLAPFSPPHIVEKLAMLSRGELVRAVDWFDLAFHGWPWVLLILKAIATWVLPSSVDG